MGSGDAGLAKAQNSSDGVREGDTRIAPDPFAAVLPALAALGAISSIAAVHWMAQERSGERPRSRRKAAVSLKDLQSCCLGLQEIFRRFQRYPKAFAGEGPPASTPLKFGVYGARLDGETARVYQQLMTEIASMLVLAAQNSFDVMAAIEDGEIDPPESLFLAFAEQQERLNKLIAQRATLKASVDTGLDVAERLTALVTALRQHKVE